MPIKRTGWNQLIDPADGSETIEHAGWIRRGRDLFYICDLRRTHHEPVNFRLVENNHKLRAIYGRYQEIYHWDGLLFTLVASLAVFVLAWCAVRGIGEALESGHSTEIDEAQERCGVEPSLVDV